MKKQKSEKFYLKKIGGSKKIYNKICVVCQKEFQSNNPNKIVCFYMECRRKLNSKNARERNFKIGKTKTYVGMKINCKFCGKEFKAKKHQKYCSEDCKKDNNKKKIEHTLYRYQKNEEECFTCGKLFIKKSKQHKHCSSDCLNLGSRIKRSNKRGLEYRPAKGRKLECKFDECDKKFISKNAANKFCSFNCRRKSYRKHNNYRSDPNNYTKILKIAKENNWFHCLICGKDLINNIQKVTVEHLVPYKIAKELGWSEEKIHCIENLRLSHFRCNMIRKDTLFYNREVTKEFLKSLKSLGLPKILNHEIHNFTLPQGQQSNKQLII